MSDKNLSKKSYGFKNVEPARNSTVFLPHIPGKNFDKPCSYDDVSIYDTILFDDMDPSDGDEFCYNVAEYEADFESVPTALTGSASAETETETASQTAAVATTTESVADTAASSSSVVTLSASFTTASSAVASSASSETVAVENDSADSASGNITAAAKTASAEIAASSSSVPSDSASSESNKRKRTSEPKAIGHLVSGPSYCATKKKPVKRPLSSRMSVITYPVKTYKKPAFPKQVPFAASRSSGGPTNGPAANISAAIACSSFTPSEYAKKVKALELLTGQRDVSVNPFCKIVVTGIDPQPFRLVKKGLIDLSILVCMVVNIQFVGKTTEFTIYKSYKGTFLYKLASNPYITVIDS
ncbi:hypothetical protein AYI69_g9884 [Smittium culicis]|uniref:Uncharacterized protein n=1 Tax=Smittium culicis TaxID=133412 RepID=A0A1R1X9I9_9FUNG|nr:hypothetical protein AYI69_g9884 [Smittium culicis]